MITPTKTASKKVTARRALGVAVGVFACAGLAVGPAVATPTKGKPHHRPSASAPKVIASGLDNPRQLTFDAWGDLYVAEAGHGGSGACIPSSDDPTAQNCFGLTGAIAQIRHGHVKRVVTGLPSLAPQKATKGGQMPPGAQAVGPSDVEVSGRSLAFTIGLGAAPANRFTFSAESSSGHLLGTVATARMSALSRFFGVSSAARQVGDLAAFEQVANPAPPKDKPDTNPNALIREGSGYVVADAGGNDLLRISKTGKVSLIATFPAITKTCSPPIQAESVPTSVVKGPGNAYYVSELTGYPFCEGAARIWKVKNGRASVYASGLTNVTDLAFDRYGTRYAVSEPPAALERTPMGAVVAISRGGGSHHRTIASGLMAPYGIALRGDTAYVTTGSVLPKSAGGGQVQAIKLPRR